jgi:multidrug efflux system outer membrane protein
LALLIAGALSGCASLSVQDAPIPPLAIEASFENNLDADDTAPPTFAAQNTRWYEDYNDPTLNAVVERARTNNLSVTAALDALEVARAQLGIAETVLMPSLDAFFNVGLGALSVGDGDVSADGSAGLSGVFDPDITGGNKARRDAATARLTAASLNVEDIQRLIIERVVLDYIRLRRAGTRLALLDETLELQRQTLDIVDARFRAGLSPALDVDRAAADLARSTGQRGLFEAARKDAAYSLSILSGDAPSSAAFDDDNAPAIPSFSGAINLGAPADLLRQRPDVRQAEAELIAASELIGAERADLLPSLRLPGTLSAAGGDGREVVSLSLSALVDLPLFDFGRRKLEVKAQEARARAALTAYRATLLDAQGEVESALVTAQALRERRAALETAGARSQSAYNQLEALYREGLAGFIDILDGQRTLIQIREQSVETDADLASALAQLNSALGGGVSS